jgi:hypothetical protein
MARQIGGFSVEARYFILEVPDGWKETDPLPAPSPDDRWYDSVTEFKAALRGPWIRRPVRRRVWKKARRAVKPAAAPAESDLREAVAPPGPQERL